MVISQNRAGPKSSILVINVIIVVNHHIVLTSICSTFFVQGISCRVTPSIVVIAYGQALLRLAIRSSSRDFTKPIGAQSLLKTINCHQLPSLSITNPCHSFVAHVQLMSCGPRAQRRRAKPLELQVTFGEHSGARDD